MSDLILMGAPGGVLYQPDAIESYPSSAEPAASAAYLSKAYAPYGHESEAIFRRLIVTVQYASSIALTAAVYVDGRKIPDTIAYLARSAGPERYTWTVPLGVRLANGMVAAVRGTVVQVEFTASAPDAGWFIHPPVIQSMKALGTRRTG